MSIKKENKEKFHDVKLFSLKLFPNKKQCHYTTLEPTDLSIRKKII